MRSRFVLILLNIFFLFNNPVMAQVLDSCLSVLQVQKISSTQGGFNATIDNNDQIGYSITSIGDFNNDGISDIAFSAVNDDDGGTDRGAIYLGFMNANGTIASYQKISSVSGSFGTGLGNGDNLGLDLASVGDLNGDGVVDLVASVTEDNGTSQGAVWIMFLNSSGTVDSKQKITELQGGFTGTLDSDDYFVRVSSIGDINNDGTNDIAVGSTGDDDGGSNRGAVWILTLNSNGTVSDNYKISDLSGNFSGVLANEDQFGYSIALLGDPNSDGLIDIAVSANKDDDGIGSDHGAIYVLSLSDTGTVVTFQKISATTTNLPIGSGDIFGSSLYCDGDLNSDGLVDLLVGSPFNDNGATHAGAAFILSFDSSLNLSTYRKISSTSTDFGIILGNEDLFGSEVFAWDDVDGNGVRELIIGAKYDDDGGSNKGAMYVLFMEDTCCSFPASINQSDTTITVGSTLGFTDTDTFAISYTWIYEGDTISTSASSSHTFYHAGTREIVLIASNGTCIEKDTVTIEVELDNGCIKLDSFLKITDNYIPELGSDDQLGYAIAPLGDLNGDGVPDLAVGAQKDDDGGTDRGAVYILFLQNDGSVGSYQKISSTSGNFGSGLDNDDRFGFGIANLGDLNSDGVTDIAVSAIWDDDGGADRGAVYILYLDSSGNVQSKQKISQTQGNFTGSLSNGDRFGRSIANIGDINGDGVIDLAVTAPYDDDGGTDRGAVWILMMNSNGTVQSNSKISSTQGSFTGTNSNTSYFGSGVCNLGDINGDGFTEIAVGSPHTNNNDGTLYILTIDASGSVIVFWEYNSNNLPGIAAEANFGTSVSGMDLNNNGLMDLAVGAQMSPNSSNQPVGGYYILELNQGIGVSSISLFSTSEYSLGYDTRFGSGVAFIGDINGDGIPEIATTAVYDDDAGTNAGALYINFMQDTCCNVVADFSLDDNIVCINETATVTNNSQNAVFYEWYVNDSLVASNSTTSFSFSTAGSYEIKLVASDSTCSRETIQTLTVAASPNADAGSSTFICEGDSVQLSASGGVSYTWNDSISLSNHQVPNPFAFPVTTAIYFVTVTDANGCTDTDNLAVIVNQKPIVSVTGDSFICANIPTQLQASGAVSYSWSPITDVSNPSVFNPEVSPTVNTTYTVTGTDANGCTDTASYTITIDTSLSASLVSITDVTCFGGNDGSATAASSGGTAPYAFFWPQGETSSSIANKHAGMYWVTVTDSEGCKDSAEAIIEQPDSIEISFDVLPVSCNGLTDGSVSAFPTGGTPPFTYSWSNGAASAINSNLPAASYTITVTDDLGCQAMDFVMVPEPAALQVSTTLVNDVSCNGGSNGSATANGMGGTPPYSYSWDNGETNAVASNLDAGTHTVTITDANGCTDTSSVSIAEPAALGVSANVSSNVSCFNGSDAIAIASGTGGSSPYLFFWSNGATGSAATGLAAEMYTVTVLDANGCTALDSVTPFEPTELEITIDSSKNVLCNGFYDGAAYTSASGGVSPYFYEWSNGALSDDLDSLTSGTYILTVTDGNACMATVTTTVVELDPVVPVISANPVTCYGYSDGSASVVASGGGNVYNYQWSTSSTSTSVIFLPAGVLSVTVTDEHQCHGSDTIIVQQPDSISFNFSVTHASCDGFANGEVATAVVGGTAPYNYAWNNGLSTTGITGIDSGIYSLTITDAHNCTNTGSVLVDDPGPLSAFTSEISSVSCAGANDGSGYVAVSGGTAPYTYQWHNGTASDSIENLAGGTYPVTVTDSKGCITTADLGIFEPPILDVNIGAVEHLLCYGDGDGSAEAIATGGTAPYSYLWSDGSVSSHINGVDGGSYSLTVTDSNGCTVGASISIDEPTAPLSIAFNVVNAQCYGGANGSIASNITGGTQPYSYNWSNGIAQSVNDGITAGNYNLTVTDAHGCTVDSAATITQPALPGTAQVTSQDVLCKGGATGFAIVTFNGMGYPPYTYNWSSGGSQSQEPNLAVGAYQVSITDSVGCLQTASFNINEPDSLKVDIPFVQNVSCYGFFDGTAVGVGMGGSLPYTFNWSNGSFNDSLLNVGQGLYEVTIQDANGCMDSTEVLLTEPTLLEVSINILNTVSCAGNADGLAELTASGGTQPYTYEWNDGSTDTLNPSIPAGDFHVEITDANGCIAHDTATMVEPDTLHISILSVVDALCSNSDEGSVEVTVSGGTPAYQYHWSTNDTTSGISGLFPGNYSLWVSDANGCMDTITIAVGHQFNAPIVYLGPDQVACAGDSLQLSPGGGFSHYLWSTGDGSPLISVGVSDTFYITATDVNGCTGMDDAYIYFNPGPQPYLGNDTLVCTNHDDWQELTLDAGPGASYNWSTGGQIQSIEAVSSGLYSVTVTDSLGCEGYDDIMVVYDHCDNINGLGENTTRHAVIYPNPASKVVFLRLEEKTTGSLIIRNIQGQMVYLEKVETIEGDYKIDISLLAAGTYTVSFHTERWVYYERVIVQ